MLIIFKLHNKIYIESFTPKIIFLKSSDVTKLLMEDSDGYVSSLSPMDLNKRGVQSVEEYKNIISESTLDFNVDEKKILTKCIIESQTYIEKINNKFINTSNLSSLDWKLALTGGDVYELGLAHTRNDVIFLTPTIIKSKRLVNTLIHEKIHVYQKQHKESFQKALLDNGYKIVDERRRRKDLRSNPDLDEYIYSFNNRVYDDGTGMYEHPNEKIAYQLEKNIE